MKSLSQLRVLTIDKGQFIEAAIRIARDVKQSLYCVPNYDFLPKPHISMIGHGVDEIEVVDDIFGDHFEYVDLFVFLDNSFGKLQNYLESIGKKCWGAGLAECLEEDRIYCKEVMKEVGLPLGKYKVIKGIPALRIYLKENENQFVKVPKYRGIVETFKARTLKEVEPLLDKLEFTLGPISKILEFVVEEELPDKCELGMDTYNILGQFPTKCLGGLEKKDCGYAGVLQDYNKFPEPLRRVDKALAPILEQLGQKGCYSTECRIGKDHEPYLIDLCMRNPSPPSQIYLEMYSNFTDILWNGANGICIDPVHEDDEGPYGVQVMMESDWAEEDHWQPIDFKEEDRRWIKLQNFCIIENQYYIVPMKVWTGVGSIIGLGKSFEMAKKKAEKVAEGISGYHISVDTQRIDDSIKALDDCKKYGLQLYEP